MIRKFFFRPVPLMSLLKKVSMELYIVLCSVFHGKPNIWVFFKKSKITKKNHRLGLFEKFHLLLKSLNLELVSSEKSSVAIFVRLLCIFIEDEGRVSSFSSLQNNLDQLRLNKIKISSNLTKEKIFENETFFSNMIHFWKWDNFLQHETFWKMRQFSPTWDSLFPTQVFYIKRRLFGWIRDDFEKLWKSEWKKIASLEARRLRLRLKRIRTKFILSWGA